MNELSLLSKDALLGASDLVEREIDLPSIGGSVRIRSLPAAYSNEATQKALTHSTDARGEQKLTVDVTKMEALQVQHALVDPKLDSLDESLALARQIGAAWKTLVEAIDDISGTNKEAVEDTTRRFQPSGQGASGQVPGDGTAGEQGNGGPDLPVPAGAGAGNADRGDR